MRVAAISDDGSTISRHFGRAHLYVVATIEDGKIVNKETRPKVGHHSFSEQGHDPGKGEQHGYDSVSLSKHAQMASTCGDCQVLLAGGMGWGAYDSLKSYGIEPIITDIENINEAVQAYLDGTIENLMERLH